MEWRKAADAVQGGVGLRDVISQASPHLLPVGPAGAGVFLERRPRSPRAVSALLGLR